MEAAEIDYGPLNALIGKWEGDKGIDIAPEPDGEENNPYYETIIFTPVADVTNAESQVLVALHYRQIVRRKSNDKIFHDETGYWMWDAAEATVMHSLTIPRGVCLLAGGQYSPVDNESSEISLQVSAGVDDEKWGIVQSPFMTKNAETTRYSQSISVKNDTLNYSQTMIVDIYGKVFEHTDKNELKRV